VDGLFLAVRTLNLMSVQPKLNYIKFWPGVFYFNAMELIGSHAYRATLTPTAPRLPRLKKTVGSLAHLFQLPLSLRHSSSCDRII
jgi:hypothetical protein